VAKLGPAMKPMVMPHYPHMLAEDITVWSLFLRKNPGLLQKVWYDVKVGAPMPLPVGATDIQRLVALGVSRKRIDVVGFAFSQYWVIEVKPYGNMVALGQAVAYTGLFKKEYEVVGKVVGVVVCATVDKDLIPEFERQQVNVIEVGLV